MSFTRAAYTPTDGLKNTSSFPTNPVDETAARKQIQDVFDQIKDDVNVLEAELEATGAAAKIGCTGAYSTLQAFINAIETAGSGSLPPSDSITSAMLKDNVVIEAKISNSAVTTDKVNNNAITAAKLATAVQALLFFPGFIGMWSGLISAIPTGWQLCDGTNGTPDLRNKFVMCAADQAGMNATGGSNTKTLTTNELPSHTHTISTDGAHTHSYNDKYGQNNGATSGNDSGSSAYYQNVDTSRTTGSSGDHTHTIGSTGTGSSYDSRPAYYALAYIMKL